MIAPAPIAGRKGRRGPPPPTRAPNSLVTTSVVRIIDLLGEGEIEGLVDGLKSIYLDGTPVQNADGSYNHEDLVFEQRYGLETQTPTRVAEGGTRTTTLVNTKVAAGAPVTRTVTDATVGVVEVGMRFPQLFEVADNGDIGPTEVRFKIDVRPNGGAWTTEVDQTIEEKTNVPADLSWLIVLTGAAPHSIRVTRVTADSTEVSLKNETWWRSLVTIVPVRQQYPHSAIMALTALTTPSRTTLPTRAYEVKGLKVQIPSDYNPTTRAYLPGTWNGSFKNGTHWTDNPAWVAYDLIANDRYGCGCAAQMPAKVLSALKWRLYRIGRWCDNADDASPDALRPRYRFAGVIESQVQARRVLADVFGMMDCALYTGGEDIVPVQWRPVASLSAVIGAANVVGGRFEYGAVARRSLISGVLVQWNDPEQAYRRAIELVIDDDLVARYGYRTRTITAMFCTDRGQARRAGLHLLYSQEHESAVVRWRMGIEGALLRPGDVVLQTDPVRDGKRLMVRISGWDATTRTLTADSVDGIDKKERWKCSFVTVKTVGAEEVSEVRTIDVAYKVADAESDISDTGDIVLKGPIAPALTSDPVAWAPVVLERTDLTPRRYRILSSVERGPMDYEISARAYDGSRYAMVEGAPSKLPPDSTIPINEPDPDPDKALPAPTSVGIRGYEHLVGVTREYGLTVGVGFSTDPRVATADVELRLGTTGPWEPLGVLTGPGSLDVPETMKGSYYARARHRGRLGGQVSAWTTSTRAISPGPIHKQEDVPDEFITFGMIVAWPHTVIPSGWLRCNGAAVSRTGYPKLFAVIGTRYGAGDGSTTFNVPDLRGRAVVGAGGTSDTQLASTVGATGGAREVTLDVDEIPAHTHTQGNHTHTQPTHTHTLPDHTHTYTDSGASWSSVDTGDEGSANVGVPSGASSRVTGAAGAGNTGAGGGDNTGAAGAGNTGSTGGGEAHDNIQPSIVAHWIIRSGLEVT